MFSQKGGVMLLGRYVCISLSLFVLGIWPIQSSHASNMALPLGMGGGSYRVPVESFKEARFRDVIRQERDFSCGSASLATLLNFHYNRPVSEHSVLKAMFETGDKEKIQKQGFSLLDMKKYLASIGIASDGYKTNLDKLAEVGIPAIVLINSRGYMHFVVVKGVTKDKILLGDPALGRRTMSRAEFEKNWNGILFVIRDDVSLAKQTFNQSKSWKLHEKAPLSIALNNQSLASFTSSISLTPGYFR